MGKEIEKQCAYCKALFHTFDSRKNMCSPECRHKASMQNKIVTQKRKKQGEKVSCLICGFYLVTDIHHEAGEIYNLCPNHHAMITRGVASLSGLLEGTLLNPDDDIAQPCIYGDKPCQRVIHGFVNNSK